MSFFNKHKRGIIGTVIYHIILILLLFLFGFKTPLPLPGEEGILVNFGDSETGIGDYEPSNDLKKTEEIQQEETPEVKPSTPPVEQTSKEESKAKEVAMVQDYEKTAAIDAELERKLKAEKERQRKIQEEIIRKREEEEARKKALEKERKEREERQRRIEERTKSAFGKNSSNNGSGKKDSSSQGVTWGSGNQGVKTGSPNSNTYGDGGKGTGDKGSGVSFSLKGRNALSLPKPKYPGDDEGVVVVKVTVDKYGKVKTAEPGVRGTTLMNKKFWNEAKKAALSAKFNVDDKAPAFQQGTISYRFVLN